MPQHMQKLMVRKKDVRQITAVLATEYPVQRGYGNGFKSLPLFMTPPPRNEPPEKPEQFRGCQ